mmetsp:Transcript_44354/g.43035  ORF Transcript_44354/g.43035 Transcript_44354/m.43035 type:complete len:91 (-) Transcript_44354:829-1101(-)
MAYIDSMNFPTRKGAHELIDKFIAYYAKKFTKGNIDAAEKSLQANEEGVRKKDGILMSFFCGGIVVTAIIMTLLFIVTTGYEYDDWIADL